MALLTIVYVLLAVRSDANAASVPPALLLGAAGIFLIEFLVRLWDAPSRWVYVRGHWIDVLACVPLVGGFRVVRVLRVVRLLGAYRLVSALTAETRERGGRQSLWFLWPAVSLLWVGSSYAVWLVERGHNPAVTSYTDALYFTFITATTVGYGDVTPHTPEGKVLSGLLVFFGIGLLGFLSARLTAMWVSNETPQPSTQNDLAGLRDDLARVHARLEQQQALLLSLVEDKNSEFDGQDRSANDGNRAPSLAATTIVSTIPESGPAMQRGAAAKAEPERHDARSSAAGGW